MTASFTAVLAVVAGLFVLGALLIAGLGARGDARALWAVYRSEVGIVGGVLLPLAVHVALFSLVVVLALLRVMWELVQVLRVTAAPRRGLGLAVSAWVPLGAAALVWLAWQTEGAVLVALLFLCSEVHDSAAYLAGKLFGRRKAFPRLSPNKTVEGVLAGWVCAIAVGSAVAMALLAWSAPRALAVAGACTLAAFAGDLITSAVKRRAGVKDYPVIHPLHGGLFDIYDSLLIAAPVMAASVAASAAF